MSRPSRTAHRRVAPPSPEHRRRTVRRTTAVLASGLLAAAAVIGTAGPASAHDRLTGSSPKDGSTLTTAPTEVRLTFTDQVQQLGLTVLVRDPSGASVADGKPTIDGDTVVQALDPLAASGLYTVAYRVVSSDGHPISGRITFRATVAGASAGPSGSGTASSAPTASASPSATASESLVAASPAASTSGAGAGGAWLAAGIGLLVVVTVVGIVVLRRRSA